MRRNATIKKNNWKFVVRNIHDKKRNKNTLAEREWTLLPILFLL
ncbi:hypothetical protein M876_15120 [Elizabethkingia anophelis FMS-007]|nr:hypothetical protein M876_15120 [Elizabethkingia anophelis FMS-007]EQB91027.1 hypothetical protein C874_13015 [Elizabethkingia anophelis 502]